MNLRSEIIMLRVGCFVLLGMFAPDVFFEGFVASSSDFECSIAERAGLIDGHRL